MKISLININNFYKKKETLLFSIIILFSTLINFGLLLFFARTMDTQSFGIFYFAIIISNILFSPSIIFTLYFSRFLSKNLKEFDSYFISYQKFTIYFFFFIFIIVINILFFLNFFFLNKSYLLIFVIVLIDYFAYLAECIRAKYISQKKIIHLAKFTLKWMTLRCILAISFYYYFQTIVAPLVGIALSGLILFLYELDIKRLVEIKIREKIFKLNKELIFFSISYLFFVFYSNIDIFIVYTFYDDFDLTNYSIISLVPKSLLIILLPINTAFYSKILENAQNIKKKLLEQILIAFFSLFLITVILFLIKDNYMNFFNIKQYSYNSFMIFILLSTFLVILKRILIFLDYSKKRDFRPLILVVPSVIFILIFFFIPIDLERLPLMYFVFTILCLCIYVIIFYRNLFTRTNKNSITPEI